MEIIKMDRNYRMLSRSILAMAVIAPAFIATKVAADNRGWNTNFYNTNYYGYGYNNWDGYNGYNSWTYGYGYGYPVYNVPIPQFSDPVARIIPGSSTQPLQVAHICCIPRRLAAGRAAADRTHSLGHGKI